MEPWRISQWLRVDLPHKIAALGVPVLHVQATIAPSPRQLGSPAPVEVTVPSRAAESVSAA